MNLLRIRMLLFKTPNTKIQIHTTNQTRRVYYSPSSTFPVKHTSAVTQDTLSNQPSSILKLLLRGWRWIAFILLYPTDDSPKR